MVFASSQNSINSGHTPTWKRPRIYNLAARNASINSKGPHDSRQAVLVSTSDLNSSVGQSNPPIVYTPLHLQSDQDQRLQKSREENNSMSLTAVLLAALKDILTVERCKSLMLMGGTFWLLKRIFKEVSSLVEELQDEMREDHDNLLFSPSILREIKSIPLFVPQNEDGNNSTPPLNSMLPGQIPKSFSSRSKLQVNPEMLTSKHVFARELILKLHAAGLPLESQLENSFETHQPSTGDPSTQFTTRPKTAESVVRSLTKAEGHILSSCLLLPENAIPNLVQNAVAPLTPMQRRAQQLEEWNNIGGLDSVKESLMDLVYPLMAPPALDINVGATKSRPLVRHDAYYGDLLSHPPGVMLYGPPGCGKTLLAKALAYTAGARFLCVTQSSLLRKYVGETNIKVRALFSLARKLQPCIIFVDEMDGLFRERNTGSAGGGSDEHEVSRDLKTEFMQLWDGISASKSDRILVMGATNRPFDVDSAFLRRMPRSYFVGLPDQAARLSILSVLLKGVPLHPEFDINFIAKEVQGYAPSDLKELLRFAALIPLREARASAMSSHKQNHPEGIPSVFSSPTLPPLRPLTTLDVMRARRSVAPTQYSESYRRAMSEYVNRSNSSLQNPSPYNSGFGDSSGSSFQTTPTANNFYGDEPPMDATEDDETSALFSEDEDGISSFDDDEF